MRIEINPQAGMGTRTEVNFHPVPTSPLREISPSPFPFLRPWLGKNPNPHFFYQTSVGLFCLICVLGTCRGLNSHSGRGHGGIFFHNGEWDGDGGQGYEGEWGRGQEICPPSPTPTPTPTPLIFIPKWDIKIFQTPLESSMWDNKKIRESEQSF